MIKLIKENCQFRLTKALYKKGRSFKPHCHDETAISIVLNGVLHEEVENKLEIGSSAVTIIKPAEVMHQNIFTEDCTILCMYISQFQQKKVKYGDILKEWQWLHGLNCVPYFSKVLQSKTTCQINDNIAELLNYIRQQKCGAVSRSIPDWLKELKIHIDNEYASQINVTDLAKKYKVHRVYLARIFQKYYGQSIKAYVKALRIHHSAASIILGESIVKTAYNNGFSDQSHLNRNFKHEINQTPLEFRNLFR